MFVVGEILLLAILIAALVVFGLKIRRKKEQRSFLDHRFTEEQIATLEKRFPRFNTLPGDIRTKLDGYTNLLMNDKRYEACGGLSEVTDEMKLLISAQAALLLIGLKKHRFYPRLRSILVYPGAFHDRGRRRFGIHDEERGTLLGESWETG